MRKELAIAITWATSLVALSLIKLAALQRGELDERTLREMDDLVEMISFAIVIIKTQVKKSCVPLSLREAFVSKKCSFFTIVQPGGGGQPMFKNYVGNCRSFRRSFNNMKFA